MRKRTTSNSKPKAQSPFGADEKKLAKSMLHYEPEAILPRPVSLAELERDARESLTYAAARQPIALGSVVAAVDCALRHLLAARKPGIVDASELIVYGLWLRERIDETMDELRKDARLAKVFDRVQEAKKKLGKRFRGTGTRGLKTSAPRNRLVVGLFDYMEILRERWGLFVPADERDDFKLGLHPTLRRIVSLPPLSPKSALQYHRVGRAILQDAAGKKDYTFHSAFAHGGMFHDLANQGKALDGALNEAWRELAKRQPRDG